MMLEHTLDQVAAALRRRDDLAATLRPKIHEILTTLFAGMIQRQISRLAVQIADEDGLRRYHFQTQPVERFASLHRVRVARSATMAQPLLVAEIFNEQTPGLRGVAKSLDPDEVAELYTFLTDWQNEDAHARLEVTADQVVVLLKPRSH